MSVYHKEKPDRLHQSLTSIWHDQRIRPDQIVLVRDGPLTAGLDTVIQQWRAMLGDVLTIVTLPVQMGLASALNRGLEYCDHDLVARMDTDDVSVPTRLEKQLAFMQANPDVAVCSGLVEEWSDDLSRKLSSRALPLAHDDIRQFARYRCPINHPASMFRKAAVLKAGAYPDLFPEDYALWVHMLSQGYRFANLPDLLVKVRIDGRWFRRRGLPMLKGEIALFGHFHAIGFINRLQWMRNLTSRILLRALAGTRLRKYLYRHYR